MGVLALSLSGHVSIRWAIDTDLDIQHWGGVGCGRSPGSIQVEQVLLTIGARLKCSLTALFIRGDQINSFTFLGGRDITKF